MYLIYIHFDANKHSLIVLILLLKKFNCIHNSKGTFENQILNKMKTVFFKDFENSDLATYFHLVFWPAEILISKE